MNHDARWWNDAWNRIADDARRPRFADPVDRRHCRGIYGTVGSSRRADACSAYIGRVRPGGFLGALLHTLLPGLAGRMGALSPVRRAHGPAMKASLNGNARHQETAGRRIRSG